MVLKICTKCEKEQDISSFSKQKEYKDGHINICKKCNVLGVKKWKELNPDKVIEQKKRYYYNNLDKEKIRKIKWRLNNKEKVSSSKRKRRALELGNESSPYSLNQVLKTYGLVCYLCTETIDLKAARQSGRDGWEYGLHIDHLIALVNGGSDSLENVRPTHGLCNLKKGSKVI